MLPDFSFASRRATCGGGDEEELRRRLTEASFHAYRDNFSDADGSLFHFNLAGRSDSDRTTRSFVGGARDDLLEQY